jgi:endogenous inhibitor of DNA gyrase (YacG/DUF329 family)
MIFNCTYCGKQYESKHKNSKYCCHKCSTLARRRRTTKKCKRCGTKFEVFISDIKFNKKVYCDICKKLVFKPSIIKKCLHCGKEFRTYQNRIKEGRGKFCSRKCYELSKRSRILRKCKTCGKSFTVHPSKFKQSKCIYCSPKCQGIAFKGENHPLWRGGKGFEPYCPKFNEEFKERVRTFFGNKCQICGKSKIENKNRELAVHHVTYDKNACCNNKIAMFLPLCMSCHTKTTHNRKYWENILFTFINLYCDGKSYLNQEEVVYFK